MMKILFALLIAFCFSSLLKAQTTIDFTSPSAAVYGTDVRINIDGVMVLPSGDVNGDGAIDTLDYENPDYEVMDWIDNNSQLSDYMTNGSADLNMDGVINAIDLNFFWFPNLGLVSQVPEE
ncbi:MAG: hypothetical protein HC892_04775 [Saprospiraceae bacterium]|nr:hypothetical protein [Saprospiraceae bacterium]